VVKLVAAPAQHDELLKEFVATARVVIMVYCTFQTVSTRQPKPY
jgi:hypothetical protein